MSKYFLLFILSLFAIACSEQQVPTNALGGDRDEHGCIGSAGYQWCAHTKQCERPWELAEQVDIENTQDSFAKYCSLASQQPP
ncbi:hypothetical protein GCM10011369_21930 [Neiella marina]|uniref:Peptidase n=1 Tax=Neiella marina TaxID=508461 RepID=A0A8J2XPA4_9GAMM|nr:hypothetical protein [Neiella marina]GGA79569.1 hypothetical protein GCM10011369_21930 [Neiella marina]